jgi:hypothetical protein
MFTKTSGFTQKLMKSFGYMNTLCCSAWIYMLLTWHKNNNFPNFWLDLYCQLEKEDIYKKIATYIYQIYSNGLLKLKNMD